MLLFLFLGHRSDGENSMANRIGMLSFPRIAFLLCFVCVKLYFVVVVVIIIVYLHCIALIEFVLLVLLFYAYLSTPTTSNICRLLAGLVKNMLDSKLSACFIYSCILLLIGLLHYYSPPGR